MKQRVDLEKDILEDIVKQSKKKQKVEKEVKEKAKISKLSITLLVLDLLACISLFIFYGPYDKFRNLFITTAMETMSHKYLARTFYSDSAISKVLNSNYMKENKDTTNTDQIDFDVKDDGNYESIYEEQILKKDPNNDLYKIIEINENGYSGYLAVIYDASKVKVLPARNQKAGGQTLPTIAKENNAVVAINASGHYYPNGYANLSVKALGAVISNGKIESIGPNSGWGGGIIGFNKDNVLVLSKGSASEAIEAGIRDAVEFGPFLIVNGVPSKIVGNGGYGVAPRTAIAQRKDGIVLFLVIDGRSFKHSIGISMGDMIELLLRYKAHNAANLDGGGSSAMAVNYKIINKPINNGEVKNRYISNAFGLIP